MSDGHNPLKIEERDLLIELRTEMKAVRDDIKELKDGTATRLSILEADRVTQKDLHDHETRIRRLEYSLAIAIGGFIVIQLALNYFK